MEKLNNLLIEYERSIKAEAELELPMLDILVKQGDLSDYEYMANVSFFCHDKNMGVDEISLKSVRDGDTMIADGKDHYDGFSIWKDRFRHCYLYHSLYDHLHIRKRDARRINHACLNFECTRQKSYKLGDEHHSPSYLNYILSKVQSDIITESNIIQEWIGRKMLLMPGFSFGLLYVNAEFYLEIETEGLSMAEKELAGHPFIELTNIRTNMIKEYPWNETHDECWLMSLLKRKLNVSGKKTESIRDIRTLWIDFVISYSISNYIGR